MDKTRTRDRENHLSSPLAGVKVIAFIAGALVALLKKPGTEVKT